MDLPLPPPQWSFVNKTVLQYVVTNTPWSFYSNSRWSWFILERSRSRNIPLELTEQALRHSRRGRSCPTAFRFQCQRLAEAMWGLSFKWYTTQEQCSVLWQEAVCDCMPLRDILKVPKSKRAILSSCSYFYWFASRYCELAQHGSVWQMYAELVRKMGKKIQNQIIAE